MRSRLKLLLPGLHAPPLHAPHSTTSTKTLRRASTLHYTPASTVSEDSGDNSHHQPLPVKPHDTHHFHPSFSTVDARDTWHPTELLRKPPHQSRDGHQEANRSDSTAPEELYIRSCEKRKARASEEQIASWSLNDEELSNLAQGYHIYLDSNELRTFGYSNGRQRLELRTMATELAKRVSQIDEQQGREESYPSLPSSLSSTSSLSPSQHDEVEALDLCFRLLYWTLNCDGPSVYVSRGKKPGSRPRCTLYRRLVSGRSLQAVHRPALVEKKGEIVDPCNDLLCAHIIEDDAFDHALQTADPVNRFDRLGLLLEKATRRCAPLSCSALLDRLSQNYHDLVDSDRSRVVALLRQSYVNAIRAGVLASDVRNKLQHLAFSVSSLVPFSNPPPLSSSGMIDGVDQAKALSLAILRRTAEAYVPLKRRVGSRVAPRNVYREQRRLRGSIYRIYRFASSVDSSRGLVTTEWFARAIRLMSLRSVPFQFSIDRQAHMHETSIERLAVGKEEGPKDNVEKTSTVAPANVELSRAIYDHEIVKRFRLLETGRPLPTTRERRLLREAYKSAAPKVKEEETLWVARAAHAMLDIELKVAALLFEIEGKSRHASVSASAMLTTTPKRMVDRQLVRVMKIINVLSQVEEIFKSVKESDRSVYRQDEWTRARAERVTMRILILREQHLRAVSYFEDIVASSCHVLSSQAPEPPSPGDDSMTAAHQRHAARERQETMSVRRLTTRDVVFSLALLLYTPQDLHTRSRLTITADHLDRILCLVNRSALDVDEQNSCWMGSKAKDQLADLYWRVLCSSFLAHQTQRTQGRDAGRQQAVFWTTMRRLRELLVGLMNGPFESDVKEVRAHLWVRRVELMEKALTMAVDREEHLRNEKLGILEDIVRCIEKRGKTYDAASVENRARTRLSRLRTKREKAGLEKSFD